MITPAIEPDLRNTNLSTIMYEYLRYNRRLEASTISLTEVAFRHLVDAAGDMKVTEFTSRHAEIFQSWLIDKKFSEVTCNIYVKTTRPIFRWAYRMGFLERDPFAHLTLFRISPKRIRIFEKSEFEALLWACPTRLWQARLLLAKTAGLRRGEVLNLNVNDIDFDKQIIYIEPKKETQYTWRWVIKDKDRREVPLVPDLSRLLIAIVNELPDRLPYPLIPPKTYVRLMHLRRQGKLSDRRRVLPDDNFTNPFNRIRSRAGIRDGTFHDLRRTCITEWFEQGLQPHEVMKLAGHSEIDTTMRYYTATRESLLEKARVASSKSLKRQEPPVDDSCTQNRHLTKSQKSYEIRGDRT